VNFIVHKKTFVIKNKSYVTFQEAYRLYIKPLIVTTMKHYFIFSLALIAAALFLCKQEKFRLLCKRI